VKPTASAASMSVCSALALTGDHRDQPGHLACAQLAKHFEAVHLGHLNIEQDQGRWFAIRDLQAFGGQQRAREANAGKTLEHRFHQHDVDGVVLDIEHLGCNERLADVFRHR
jgi:hypothetical protein